MKIKIKQKNRFSVMKARYRLEHELGDYSGQFEFHKICFGVRALRQMLHQFYILVGISFGMASHLSHYYHCICGVKIFLIDMRWRRTLAVLINDKLDIKPKTKAKRAQLKFKVLFL